MDRRLARRSLALAFLVGMVAQALLVRSAPGLNVLLLAVGVLGAGLALSGGGRRIDRLDLWLPVAAVAVLAGAAVRADSNLLLLDLAVGFTLLGATTAALTGAGVTRRTAHGITRLGLLVVAWVGFGILRLTMIARRPSPDAVEARRPLPDWVARVGRGLAIAIPVVLVFAGLFSAADAVFARLAADLFGIKLDPGDLPVRITVAFLVAWIVAGLLAVASGLAEIETEAGEAAGPPLPEPQSLGAAATRPAAALPQLGLTEAMTVLVAVVLLFAMFVGLQVAYLFGGLDTLAASGMTYANYARRGFFELVAATVLASLLVVGLDAIIERRSRWFTAAAVALALLNIVILASAALRLRLYQDAYGWTELRFYIYATIAWLGIGILAASVLLIRDRMGWLPHAMVITAIAILLIVNVVGPQRLVAEQNVARLLDPSLVPADGHHSLDVGYVAYLGDDAVPALVLALPVLTGVDQAFAEAFLLDRWQELGRPELRAWPAWNLGRERAREALATLFGDPAP